MQDAEKVRQRRSRFAQRLNVPKHTPRLFAFLSILRVCSSLALNLLAIAVLMGELFWILKNGSKGTAMASFIPLVLTEEEAWQVLRYVRSFGQP